MIADSTRTADALLGGNPTAYPWPQHSNASAVSVAHGSSRRATELVHMAGDWIPIEHVTPDKPEVMRMAAILGVSENEVLGGLVRFWVWCDTQSRNGHAIGVTEKGMDRISCVTGMYDAMTDVGWLVVDKAGVHVPHYDYHLSQNAKSRALAAKRQRKKRLASVTLMSRSERDKSVTTEQNSTVSSNEDTEGEPTNVGSLVQTPPRGSAPNTGLFFATTAGQWQLSMRKLDEYRDTYGDRLDVEAELRKAKQWLSDNKGRRKTKRGMPSFLTGWLNRSYDARAATEPGSRVAARSDGKRVVFNSETGELVTPLE